MAEDQKIEIKRGESEIEMEMLTFRENAATEDDLDNNSLLVSNRVDSIKLNCQIGSLLFAASKGDLSRVEKILSSPGISFDDGGETKEYLFNK